MIETQLPFRYVLFYKRAISGSWGSDSKQVFFSIGKLTGERSALELIVGKHIIFIGRLDT